MLVYAVTAIVITATFAYLLFHELTAHDGSIPNTVLVSLSLGLLAYCGRRHLLHYRQRLTTYESKVESALAKAKQTDETFNVVVDNLPAAVVAVGRKFDILRVNERVAALHGIPAAETVGRKCYHLFGAGCVCDSCPVAKAQATKEVHKNVKREVTKDGRDIYIEQTAIPILRSSGKVRYVLEVVVDVTERVRLEHVNRDIFMQTAGALANLIDKRDTATGRHSAAVSELARGIGQELDLADDVREEIAVAALLHDIGKIGIPESILNKPGRLTPEEYAIVQTHCEIGYNALKGIKPLSRVAEYLLYHHERFDGRGYPIGRHGHEVPLVSRILCVADVFEATTSNRVYRPAMSIEEALAVMAAGRGTAFDPFVLDAFYAFLKRRMPDIAPLIDSLNSGAA